MVPELKPGISKTVDQSWKGQGGSTPEGSIHSLTEALWKMGAEHQRDDGPMVPNEDGTPFKTFSLCFVIGQLPSLVTLARHHRDVPLVRLK